jgi:hypothetical protein
VAYSFKHSDGRAYIDLNTFSVASLQRGYRRQ